MIPLNILREAIMQNQPIQLLDANSTPTSKIELATTIEINKKEYNLTEDTSYNDPQSNTLFSIGAIYYAYITKDLNHAEYFRDCTENKMKCVSLVVKRDLYDYLTGAKDYSLHLVNNNNNSNNNNFNGTGSSSDENYTSDIKDDVNENVGTSLDSINGQTNGQVLKRKADTVLSTRVLKDRSTVVTGNLTGKSFEGLRKATVGLIMKSSSASSAGVSSGNGSITSGVIKKEISTKKSTSSSGNTSSTANTSSDSKKNKKKPKGNPIIIVPSVLTSLITLYNVKEFCEKSVFVDSNSVKNSGVNKEDMVCVKKVFEKTGTTITYDVYDTTDRFRADDWDRVVAVFASGHEWQFKRWKWEAPVDLFYHVKGFHLKYGESRANDSPVKDWNVVQLEIYRHKRHLDAPCVYKFWNTLENWIASNKPELIQ